MKLLTFRTDDGTRAGRVEDDRVVELPFPDAGALLRSAEQGSQDFRTLAAQEGPSHERGGLDLAPVVVDPAKIFCVGLNYASHIEERGLQLPEHPALFAKFACTLIGAHDRLVLPKASDRVDWEGELALVIGRSVRNATREEARDALAGYAVLNDVTMRDWQRRSTQFFQGKTFEASTPFGPELVTLDELDDPEDLPIRCTVDGVVMQESRTSDLLFGPVDLIEYISVICTLSPGDVIATGTPGGVGDARDPRVYLQHGQTMRTEVEGVGELVNVCVDEGRADVERPRRKRR